MKQLKQSNCKSILTNCNNLRKKLAKIYKNYTNPIVGIIYMLHRVDDFEPGKIIHNENLKISPIFLEQFILANQDNYDFISIDTLREILTGNIKISHKPFIIFTLDDGYKDNYTKAFPIFTKYNVPFTVYVASDFPDNKTLLWWYILEEIILKNEYILLSTGKIFDCRNYDKKNSSFLQIRRIILNLPYNNFNQLFYKLLSNYNISEIKYCDITISWQEIIEMSKNPICTIGAHSVTHSRLSGLNEFDLMTEISGSKRRLEEMLGMKVNHFAYPYGTSQEVNQKVIEMAKKSGFHTAAIANGGWIRKYGTNLFSLQRMMLT